MPALRKAAATAADTSSSSVGRMRGPLEELDARTKCVEDRGDLHPRRSGAKHQHRRRDEVKPQASLWVFVNSKPGTESFRLTPPVQMMIFSA